MNFGRIAALIVAGIAALGAAYMARSMSNQPIQDTVIAEVAEQNIEQVLVARKEIAVGQRVTPEDLSWQEWPEEALNAAFLTRAKQAGALEAYSGAIARVNIAAGEPILALKLVNAGESGFMAAVLSPGMRAVSVEISVETGAGGFILPNDRVDVLLTNEVQSESDEGSGETFVARTILENVRVLAIDQSFKQVEDEDVVIGSTATLELNRADSELLALAEASGSLSLALRSIADAVLTAQNTPQSHATGPTVREKALVLYQYGKSKKLALKE